MNARGVIAHIKDAVSCESAVSDAQLDSFFSAAFRTTGRELLAHDIGLELAVKIAEFAKKHAR